MNLFSIDGGCYPSPWPEHGCCHFPLPQLGAAQTNASIMTTNNRQHGPPTSSYSTPGIPRLQEPKVFGGTDETDVEDWFTHYELVSTNNKWDDTDRLTHVIFYIIDVAAMWYDNHKNDISRHRLQTFSADPLSVCPAPNNACILAHRSHASHSQVILKTSSL